MNDMFSGYDSMNWPAVVGLIIDEGITDGRRWLLIKPDDGSPNVRLWMDNSEEESAT